MSSHPMVILARQPATNRQWSASLESRKLRVELLRRGAADRLQLVLELLGIQHDGDSPASGPLRALAITGASDKFCCCADLVMLIPDLDNVRLGGIVDDLQPQQIVEIADALNQTLARYSARIVLKNEGTGCIVFDSDLEFSVLSPEFLQGQPLRESMAAGAAGSFVRMLQNEFQMALHAHPVNAAREQAGLAPANGIWIWGGGRLPKKKAFDLPPILTDDSALTGFWIHSGHAARVHAVAELKESSLDEYGVISIDPDLADDVFFDSLRALATRRIVYVVPPFGEFLRVRRRGLFDFLSLIRARQ